MEPMRETEALRQSAPLALRLAPRLCEGCAWFHGIWQLLRLLGINTTPQHHATFFRKALVRACAAVEAPRILISGTADYSLLAHLLPALPRRARITVLDRCPTPLALNRWYARREGIRIATKRSDILELKAPVRFDVVCTHSFLGQFSPLRRKRLLGVWRKVLRPGGSVLTVNRLRPGARSGWLKFSDEHARSLESLVVQKAKSLPLSTERLARMTREYGRRMGAWPIRSESELTGIFEQCGFDVEHLSARPVVLRPGRGLSGPTTPGGAPYACIAARRR
jgi:SAM-dependent methyltransferase